MHQASLSATAHLACPIARRLAGEHRARARDHPVTRPFGRVQCASSPPTKCVADAPQITPDAHTHTHTHTHTHARARGRRSRLGARRAPAAGALCAAGTPRRAVAAVRRRNVPPAARGVARAGAVARGGTPAVRRVAPPVRARRARRVDVRRPAAVARTGRRRVAHPGDRRTARPPCVRGRRPRGAHAGRPRGRVRPGAAPAHAPVLCAGPRRRGCRAVRARRAAGRASPGRRGGAVGCVCGGGRAHAGPARGPRDARLLVRRRGARDLQRRPPRPGLRRWDGRVRGRGAAAGERRGVCRHAARRRQAAGGRHAARGASLRRARPAARRRARGAGALGGDVRGRRRPPACRADRHVWRFDRGRARRARPARPAAARTPGGRDESAGGRAAARVRGHAVLHSPPVRPPGLRRVPDVHGPGADDGAVRTDPRSPAAADNAAPGACVRVRRVCDGRRAASGIRGGRRRVHPGARHHATGLYPSDGASPAQAEAPRPFVVRGPSTAGTAARSGVRLPQRLCGGGVRVCRMRPRRSMRSARQQRVSTTCRGTMSFCTHTPHTLHTYTPHTHTLRSDRTLRFDIRRRCPPHMPTPTPGYSTRGVARSYLPRPFCAVARRAVWRVRGARAARPSPRHGAAWTRAAAGGRPG